MEQRHTISKTEGIMNQLNSLPKESTVWEILHHTDRPIVLYGTGNGGDKLIDALAKIGRTPQGVFASDGFVRNRTFHDMPVLSLAETEKRFGKDMIILCAFGSSVPDVMDHMCRLDNTYTFYMPELPLYSGELFDYDYFAAHKDELELAYCLMSDEPSRNIFCDVLEYRLSGKIEHLQNTETFDISLSSLLATDKVYIALDGGAYNGDTAKQMMDVFPHLSLLIAAEPDARTFRKLSAYAETSNGIVQPINCALGDFDGTYTFSSSGSRGSGIAGKNMRAKTVEVESRTLDALCADKEIDLIKLDIEGNEGAALRAVKDTVTRSQPALAVSLYHKTEDLFSLPLQVASICGDNYAYYLRRVPCYPAWDLMLYAIPDRLKAQQNP